MPPSSSSVGRHNEMKPTRFFALYFLAYHPSSIECSTTFKRRFGYRHKTKERTMQALVATIAIHSRRKSCLSDFAFVSFEFLDPGITRHQPFVPYFSCQDVLITTTETQTIILGTLSDATHLLFVFVPSFFCCLGFGFFTQSACVTTKPIQYVISLSEGRTYQFRWCL